MQTSNSGIPLSEVQSFNLRPARSTVGGPNASLNAAASNVQTGNVGLGGRIGSVF